MEAEILKVVVMGGVAWWSALFLVVRATFSGRSFDFCNRIVSTVHATLAVTLAALTVDDWSCPVCPVDSASSFKQRQVLGLTISYLIYDLACCHLGDRVTLDNTIHHLVSIIGLGAGLLYHKCGSEQIAALFITEMSSPFLHLRELLKEIGFKDTDLNLAADIMFAGTFTVARMVGGPYLTYVTLSADNPLLIKAMAVGLQLVSAFWFFKIVRMVKYKLNKRVSNTAPRKKLS